MWSSCLFAMPLLSLSGLSCKYSSIVEHCLQQPVSKKADQLNSSHSQTQRTSMWDFVGSHDWLTAATFITHFSQNTREKWDGKPPWDTSEGEINKVMILFVNIYSESNLDFYTPPFVLSQNIRKRTHGIRHFPMGPLPILLEAVNLKMNSHPSSLRAPRRVLIISLEAVYSYYLLLWDSNF